MPTRRQLAKQKRKQRYNNSKSRSATPNSSHQGSDNEDTQASRSPNNGNTRVITQAIASPNQGTSQTPSTQLNLLNLSSPTDNSASIRPASVLSNTSSTSSRGGRPPRRSNVGAGRKPTDVSSSNASSRATSPKSVGITSQWPVTPRLIVPTKRKGGLRPNAGRPAKQIRISAKTPNTSANTSTDAAENIQVQAETISVLIFDPEGPLELPIGPSVNPGSGNRVATVDFTGNREELVTLWNNPNLWLMEDMVYTYQRYLSFRFSDKKVAVLAPLMTNLEFHYRLRIPLTAIDNCYNHSEDYDILLMCVIFPGHFTLIIFDRTDRQEPKCVFVDPLPQWDRLYDQRYPQYDHRRLGLLSKLICDLTPGLNFDDFVIRTLHLDEYTQQRDGINCGIFVCLYSEAYLLNDGNLILPFDMDINFERKRVLWNMAQCLTTDAIPYVDPPYIEEQRAIMNRENSPFDFGAESWIDGENPQNTSLTMFNFNPVINLDPQTVHMNAHIIPRRRSVRIQNILAALPRLPSPPPAGPTYVPITSRCHLRHREYSCADVRAGHFVEYYQSGKIGDKMCHYCKALLLNSEVHKQHFSKYKVISSNYCCYCGKISLPPYKEHPLPLRELSRGNTKESKEFLSHMNMYNNLLAFASVSVGHKSSSLHGGVCFMLNGEFKRQMSSMFAGGMTPSFSQLYILDPAIALDTRTNNTRYGGDKVDAKTLERLDKVIRDCHPLAKELLNFHQQYQRTLEREGQDAVKTFRLTLLEARDAPPEIRDATLHPRQVNLPHEGENLFALWTETATPPQLQGIWVTGAEGRLSEFPAYHPLTDTLCYPLLFPRGDDGYHKKIPLTDQPTISSRNLAVDDGDSILDMGVDVEDDNESMAESGASSVVSDTAREGTLPGMKRKFVTLREYARYRMAIRDGEDYHNIWNSGGGLSQRLILDWSARIDAEVAEWLRRPDMDLRATYPEHALRWLARNAGLNSTDEIGSVIMFRKNQPGTRPFFQDMYYDCTSIMARFRRPGTASFMFTFTCNPYWEDIKNNLLHKDQKVVDRPDVICRIYEDKLRYLHHLLDEKKIFGPLKGSPIYGESREYQKKIGGPHAHRVLSTDMLAVPENIDNMIWAHIPDDPDQTDQSPLACLKRKVRELLPKFQLHTCGAHCRDHRGRCKKGFPKRFSEYTILHDDKPAVYYRPAPKADDSNTMVVKLRGGIQRIDNSLIVPYNPMILCLFETHHNLEFCYGQSDNLKYCLKYPFKGQSFSYLENRPINGRFNVDEPAFYAKMLYRSPPEAFSRIMGYKYAYLSHTVIPLIIHLPGEQRVFIPRGREQEIAEQIAHGWRPDTPLTRYWEQWKANPEFKDMLFENVPEKYRCIQKTKQWRKRVNQPKKKLIIGRILPVSPREPERFALYILMKHFPGDPEHLKTVNGQICETFIEAARLRGLIEDNEVWVRTLTEAAASLMPNQMRQLFANILVFGSTEECIIDGGLLWEKFMRHMYDGRCSDAQRPRRIDRALALIERLLHAQGKQMSDYGLPQPLVSIANDRQRQIDEFFFPEHVNDDEADETVDTGDYERAQLNTEQQNNYATILNAVRTPPSDQTVNRLFFLYGDGGTGKTYLLNYIIYQLRRQGKKVLATASTGIASTKFYAGGMTIHSAFRLGINIEPGRLPQIGVDTFFGRRIIEADVIITDEITMLNKTVLENVDSLCSTLATENKEYHFGGKVVIISGDWKQALPVVNDSYIPQAAVAICLQSSSLFPYFQKLHLRENMRIRDPRDVEWKRWLNDVGTGKLGDSVAIPADLIVQSREELYGFVFEDYNNLTADKILNRLLLAIRNNTVDLHNNEFIRRLAGQEHDYYSVDRAIMENPFAVNAADYQVANINLLTPSGMPAHHLRLKVGCVIVLLVNLNTSRGLCNGTRFIVRRLSPNLIEAEAIFGMGRGITVGISRVRTTYEDKRPMGVSFERLQFPVRVAYAMTITKAQGQTCERIGIDFSHNPFAHGQLYTALSRASSRNGIRIYAPNKFVEPNGDVKITNIVARGIQFD